MPYNDPDPRDPNMLVGVSVPAEPEAVREMAYAFAEEFAALGYDERRLMALFKQPFYAGPHRAYRALGEEAIGAIVAESVGLWGRVRTVVRAPRALEPQSGRRRESLLVQIGGRGGREGRTHRSEGWPSDPGPTSRDEEAERCRT